MKEIQKYVGPAGTIYYLIERGPDESFDILDTFPSWSRLVDAIGELLPLPVVSVGEYSTNSNPRKVA